MPMLRSELWKWSRVNATTKKNIWGKAGSYSSGVATLAAITVIQGRHQRSSTPTRRFISSTAIFRHTALNKWRQIAQITLARPIQGLGASETRRTLTTSGMEATNTTGTPAAAASSNALLQDDYSIIDMSMVKYYKVPSFTLENGTTFEAAPIAYCTYGKLNAEANNAILVCHALTGHASLHNWWGELLGPGKAFDTDKYFIICPNLLGSCYGTLGPLTLNPKTNRKYGGEFPVVTVRDSVRLQYELIKALGVNQIKAVVGGSLGGMHALEWSFYGADFVRNIVSIACNAQHTAWQIAVNHVQRRAIMSDPNWKNGMYDQLPAIGLSLARQFAMISYRTQPVYEKKFQRDIKSEQTSTRDGEDEYAKAYASPPTITDAPSFDVEQYLRYQGEKILSRFDAMTYVRLTQMLDSHDIGRGRGGKLKALSEIQQPTLIIGITSDVLYPVHEQEELAKSIKNSTFLAIDSLEGHDGFLLEKEAIGNAIVGFLNNNTSNLRISKL